MTEQTKRQGVRSRVGRWSLMGFAGVLSVIGLILLVRGATLMALGGSWYYAIAGLLLLMSGVLLFLRRVEAAGVYAAVFVGTILWAFWEVGLSFWPLVPRLAPVLVLAFLFTLLFPSLSGGQRRKESYALAGVLLLVMVVGSALMFKPHGVVRQTVANAPLLDALPAGENWQYYGRTPRGTRFAPEQQITKDNVTDLQVAWIFRTGELPGHAFAYAYQNTPTQIGDTLYICTPRNKVFALDAETGQQRWVFDPQAKSFSLWNRCRGVGYYEPATQSAIQAADDGTCAQRIVLTTIDARLIQLDANTGLPCADFGDNGSVDLTVGLGEVKPGWYYPTAMPTVIGNLILVGAWILDGAEINEPSGVIRAFSADTGALVWAWDMGNPDMPDLPPEGYTRGTPNMWGSPAFDDELGLVYLPLGNGTPDFWGAHRTQATNDHASSVVALDIETGRERWTFQTVHIDTWDYDIGTQPALYDIPDDNGGVIPALIQATKTGQIYVLDRRDGTPVFPVEERPVPQGHQPGNSFSLTQPFSVGMPAFGGDPLTEQDMWGITFFDQLECRIAFKRLKYEGIYTPIVTDVVTMFYPGMRGGMNWGSVAVDEQRGLLIVNDIRLPSLAIHVPQGSASIEMAAAIGLHGEGLHPQVGTPYSTILGQFNSGLGIPCHAPPWGVLAAVDMRTGSLVWQRPAGTVEDVVLKGVKTGLHIPIGMPTLGGPLSTASGLVFFAGTQDHYLRAFDVQTGDEVWKARLPVGAQATPMTYTSPASGRQFVVIAAGGAPSSPDLGDYFVAYALPHNN